MLRTVVVVAGNEQGTPAWLTKQLTWSAEYYVHREFRVSAMMWTFGNFRRLRTIGSSVQSWSFSSFYRLFFSVELIDLNNQLHCGS